MSVTMRQMLEAGVHFGRQTRYWDPKMAPFIFGDRNKIHIVNLEKTLPMFEDALKHVRTLAANKGRILFVGTKRQARDIIKEEATRAGCAYVNHRWLGGMLTNFGTIKKSIARMEEIRVMQEDGTFDVLPKKEVAALMNELEKLERNLGGIKNLDVNNIGAIFIVDPRKERIAIAEAKALNIPIVAIVDTNCDPDEIDYIIPGNDDAIRAVKLITARLGDAILEARQGEEIAE